MSATLLLAANPLPLTLITCLDDLGYEVVTAEGGRGMLEHLGRRTLDLLILDADMLMASGLGTCEKLTCLLKHYDLPVIMTSTLSNFRERSVTHLVNAKVVLHSPMAGEVAAMVEGLLGNAYQKLTQADEARRWRTAS